MKRHGYVRTLSPEAADVLLLNTCSIRDKAEQKALPSPAHAMLLSPVHRTVRLRMPIADKLDVM